MAIDKQSRKSSLEYGKLAPNFELESADGQTFTRSQFRGKSGLVLIFFEDTPEARTLLQQIAADKDEYSQLNSRIFGIARATRDELAKTASALSLPFTLLADPHNIAWKAYSGSDEPGYGVFVLDLYGGADAQAIADSVAELPNAKTILQWTQAAQFKCSI
jgi:peroxiredoxin